MFELLGICLLLATLLTFNSLATLVTAALWRLFGNVTRSWSATGRARVIFFLRTFPASVAILFVLLLIVPSYLAYEPRHGAEDVSYKLALLAFVSTIGLVLAMERGLAAWRVTARLTADWIAQGEPIAIPGINIPSYRIDHYFPVIAIVGILRPRLFIATQVLDLLTAEEINAALSHEKGHLTGRDNMKRGLLRACRDSLLIIPCGRSLDRDWAEASEEAADERAASEGRNVALDLASALVKIARIIPEGARPTMPAGVFLFGDDEGAGILGRVRHLLAFAADADRPMLQSAISRHITTSAFAGLAFCGVALAFNSQPVLSSVHSLIEHVVFALS
ncbi:MAG TPA: M48 family metalloprotease [Pyrinomonadaceae bacterium]|nr:M48 family metalloprotease [Pyrinomonadaceae bacterium]